ncbi:MAG: hypothetical protein AB7V48_04060 [Sedimentibacter sp.]
MVTNLLNKYQNQYVKSKAFIKYIKEIYKPRKITEKMDEFYNYAFSDFYSELKKKGVKLKANQQMDLMMLFDEKKQEWQQLNNEINVLENKLDHLIYKIYNLSTEERNTAKMYNIFTIWRHLNYIRFFKLFN